MSTLRNDIMLEIENDIMIEVEKVAAIKWAKNTLRSDCEWQWDGNDEWLSYNDDDELDRACQILEANGLLERPNPQTKENYNWIRIKSD